MSENTPASVTVGTVVDFVGVTGPPFIETELRGVVAEWDGLGVRIRSGDRTYVRFISEITAAEESSHE